MAIEVTQYQRRDIPAERELVAASARQILDRSNGTEVTPSTVLPLRKVAAALGLRYGSGEPYQGDIRGA